MHSNLQLSRGTGRAKCGSNYTIGRTRHQACLYPSAGGL